MISAPEGSIIAADGSILAADGTVLAPPGSVLTTAPEPAPTPALQQHQTAPAQQNLIGLQLPDEGGEVLYLDPADPAAQLLLQEAGIHLGEGGVLQTADGQVLQGEDGSPITTNTGRAAPAKQNNLVGDAAAAAGLGDDLASFLHAVQARSDTSAIDIPVTARQAVTNITPNLPGSGAGPGLKAVVEDRQSNVFQPRYSSQPIQPAPQQTKYQKLTFNSGATYSQPSPAPVQQRKPIAPRQKKTVPGADMQIGPDQQKVTYTVTSENGYSQTYMMICSKSLDQNTLINTLIKNISSDPNHKGKKTIKITQHKYGAKKTGKAGGARAGYSGAGRQALAPAAGRGGGAGQRRIQPAGAVQPGQVLQSQQYRQVRPAAPAPRPVPRPAPSPMKPPQQILQSEPDPQPELQTEGMGEGLTLEDIVKQMGAGDEGGAGTGEQEPRVMVKCNYCTNFRCVLNSQTWENILNHILPVAKEELHCRYRQLLICSLSTIYEIMFQTSWLL